MTREEAIDVLENGYWWDDLNEYISKTTMQDLQDALDCAIAALREQEERSKPKEAQPMDVREKLVELVNRAITDWEHGDVSERIADHLIAHGVTVQEWIPVTERLPDNKEHDWVLAQVVDGNGYMHIPKVMEYRQSKKDWFEETYGWLSEHNGAFTVTHWMPLPQPPKGGRYE